MSIRKLLFIFLTTLPGPLCFLVAQGTSPGDPTADAAFQVPTTKDTSLLWRISGEGIERPSYLFGTIHLIPSDEYFLEATVVKAINDSEEVLFEIDPGDMQNPAIMMSMMSRLNMRGDTSLEMLLTTTQYDTVAAYFEQTGLPMFMLKRMKPMFLSSMVGQDMSAGNPLGGGDNAGMKSYELELAELAGLAGKPIAGLETMEFQLSLFDSIPYPVQARMLYKAVADDMGNVARDGNSEMDQMVAMYRRRAVAEMSTMITNESAGYGNFEELLLTRRNESWVPKIIDRLADTPTTYAVGAGHLGGERGVIALLRSAGYSVVPVY